MLLSPRVMAAGAIVLYALAYGASLAVLGQDPNFEAGESLGVLLIFGLGFSAIGWAATRGIAAAETPVHAPARETGVYLGYLALFAVLALGVGLTWVKSASPDGRIEETTVLLFKLATMVALPAWLFTRLGYSWRELFAIRGFDAKHWRAFLVLAAALLALQLLVGQGPRHIAALEQPVWLIALAVPLVLVWMSVEAGLAEEFMFRVLLQTRLAAWLKSETAAVIGMSILFGLAHAPGYVLRDGSAMEAMKDVPSALSAAAYSIAIVSPMGILFGVLWARTRSLLLVVLLHGWADTIPALAPFVRTWFA
jgi:membrane protease YdiL (CAAX protease family)